MHHIHNFKKHFFKLNNSLGNVEETNKNGLRKTFNEKFKCKNRILIQTVGLNFYDSSCGRQIMKCFRQNFNTSP